MPQRELRLDRRYTVDPETGYLVVQDPRSRFTPELKKDFLLKLAEQGDVEDACRLVGISRRILSPHLRADKAFKRDYKATLKAIKERPALERFQKKNSVVNDLFNRLG